MNREIKFRALFDNEGSKKWMYVSVDETLDSLLRVVWKQISPWLQFTGLHDRNGKEIYEGDILKGGAVVGWFNELTWDGGGSNHPGFYCAEWLAWESELSYHYLFDEETEVIGNIYESPSTNDQK